MSGWRRLKRVEEYEGGRMKGWENSGGGGSCGERGAV